MMLLTITILILLSLSYTTAFIAPSSSVVSRVGHRPKTTFSSLCQLSETSLEVEEPTIETNNPSEVQLGAWIPLASESSLSGLSPVKIQVCGLDLVVWESSDGFSAFMDACPHRLAPLSQGRVDPETGCLECPYHGWSFSNDGSLTSIPQLDDNKTITPDLKKNGAATSLPVHAAGDLLFVFIPTDICGESWPKSLLPEEQYPYLKDSMDKQKTYFMRELPYSIDFLIENFMDPAHIPYAHHSLQGVRDDGSPIEMTVLANNFTHAEVTFVDICRGKRREGVLSFQRPSFYHFRTKSNNDTDAYDPRLLIYAAPVRPGMCRVIMPDFKIPFLPPFLVHAASNRFLNSDSWLHDTERAVRLESNPINQFGSSVAVGSAKAGRKPFLGGFNYLAASKSDLGPSLFRRWWTEQKLSESPANFFGPAPSNLLPPLPMTRAEQINPWVHHSKNCSQCRKSLRRLKLLQKAWIAVVASLVVTLKNKPLIAVPMVVGGLWVKNFLRKLVTLVEGNNHRSEIGDRSVAAMK